MTVSVAVIAEVADGSIGSAKLADDAVIGTKIAEGTIEGRHLVDGTIGATQLGVSAVTLAALDAATLLWTQGSSARAPVRVLKDANVATLAGGAPKVVDGVTLQLGDRVLVIAQTTASQNGIYRVSAPGTGSNGTWVRDEDANTNGDLFGGIVIYIQQGTTYHGKQYALQASGVVNIDTDAQTWSLLTVASTFADGDYGDIVVSSSGTVMTIDPTVLTAFGRSLIDDADAAAARVTLGLVIGTNVQAQDAELAALAGVTSAADRLFYFTGSGTGTLATFTSFARTLIDDVDAPTARATLGLGASATDSGWVYKVLASDFNESTGSLVDVTGLFFTPAASTTYLIEVFLVWTSAAVTTGLQFTFTPPGSLGTGTTFNTQALAVEAGVNTNVLRNGSMGSVVAGTGQSSNAAQHPGYGWGMLKTGVGPSGDLKLQAQTEVAASQVTIFAGSFLRYRTIP